MVDIVNNNLYVEMKRKLHLFTRLVRSDLYPDIFCLTSFTDCAFRQSCQKDTEKTRGRETFEHEFVQNKFKTI